MQFIPKKLYYKIKEVCEIVGVEAHVLRFWETEFPSLAPPKSKTGQRTYRPKDIELLLRIRKLLYTDGYTIAGARKQLSMRRPTEDSVEENLASEGKSSKDSGIMPGGALRPSPSSEVESEKGRKSQSRLPGGISTAKGAQKAGAAPADDKAGQPPKPASERLKRLQSELENILTLLDRE